MVLDQYMTYMVLDKESTVLHGRDKKARLVHAELPKPQVLRRLMSRMSSSCRNSEFTSKTWKEPQVNTPLT